MDTVIYGYRKIAGIVYSPDPKEIEAKNISIDSLIKKNQALVDQNQELRKVIGF